MNEILQQLARRKSVRAYEEVPLCWCTCCFWSFWGCR